MERLTFYDNNGEITCRYGTHPELNGFIKDVSNATFEIINGSDRIKAREEINEIYKTNKG